MRVSVTEQDIDEQGHVNNTVYLRWVQEIAIGHWRAIASVEAQNAIDWVVLRHEIDYKAPAFTDDVLLVRTWVGKATRATFERFTEITREGERKSLASARTLWCPIGGVSHRPMRVSAEVRAQFSM